MTEEKKQSGLQSQLDQQIRDMPKHKVVEESVAPVLTPDVLLSKGRRFFQVEIVLDDQIVSVFVLRGVPMQVGLLLRKTSDVYALQVEKLRSIADGDDAAAAETLDPETLESLAAEERTLREVFVASMVFVQNGNEHAPFFSYKGEGGSYPVESLSDTFLRIFYEAVMAVQTPEENIATLARFHGIDRDKSNHQSNGA